MSEDRKFDEYLEHRAEELGLPIDPAAYQDGGLAVAATTFGVNDADFLVAMLRASDIPAWVEGAATASWYWHIQFAMHPAGIRVMVPTGRLADAQALLAEHRKEGEPRAAQMQKQAGEEAREPEEPDETAEPEDPAYPLYRRARGLAYLLLIGLLAPVVFVLAARLLVQIRRHRHQLGPSPDLARAYRMAMAVIILSFPIWGIFLGLVGITISMHLR
ncbi:MAG: hypothetical protein NTX87_09435 [Planctomycetota bacterium]|nr:hypothetical protein [Planctomycetota bacterium]